MVEDDRPEKGFLFWRETHPFGRYGFTLAELPKDVHVSHIQIPYYWWECKACGRIMNDDAPRKLITQTTRHRKDHEAKAARETRTRVRAAVTSTTSSKVRT
ncbi:MAG: hypothetical protein ABSB29_08245 [Nitrososphaerales archaeon]